MVGRLPAGCVLTRVQGRCCAAHPAEPLRCPSCVLLQDAGAPPAEEPPSEDEDDGGLDDDDLIASTAGVEQQQQRGQQQQPGQGPWAPPTVLASASLGLTRAAVVLHRAFSAAALRAPPRRALTRPQRQ